MNSTNENDLFELNVNIFYRILNPLLGWDQENVRIWLSRFGGEVTDEYSWFYHDTPLGHIMHLLIPQSMIDANLRDIDYIKVITEFRHELARALLDGNVQNQYDDQFDWSLAAKRADDVLKLYGESLDSLRSECKHRFKDWPRSIQ